MKLSFLKISAQDEDRTWFFRFTILAVLVFTAFGIFAAAMTWKYFGLDRYGYTVTHGGRGVYVTDVDPDGPAAGKLQPGDFILDINDDERFSRITEYFTRSGLSNKQILRVRFERNGTIQEAEISSALYSASETERKDRWNRNIAYLPRFFASLVVALLIGLLKPADRLARIGGLTFLAVSHQAIAYTQMPVRPLMNPAEDLIAYFLFLCHGSMWFGPFGYHMTYRLLPSVPEGRIWTYLKWLLYSAGAVLFTGRVIQTTMTQIGDSVNLRYQYYGAEMFFGRVDDWYWIVCLASISVMLIRNNHLVREPDQRRRSRLVLYGSLISILPQTLIILTTAISATTGYDRLVSSRVFEAARLVSNISLILVPICFGYAILNRQVYEINVVIRRSVQYLLAKNALRLLLALPVLGVLYVVVTNSNLSIRDLIVTIIYEHQFYILLIAAAALSLVFRGRLQEMIDRRFFREAYEQDTILRELGEEVRRLDSMSEMSRIVSRKVEAALHPERIYLFYREEDKRDLSLGYSSKGGRGELRIPEEFELLRFMEHRGEAVDFPFPKRVRIPENENEWLSSLGTSLIVPMKGTENRLAGLLLLGAKKSGSPYNGSDRRLLETLADQIAVVYENVILKEKVARERKIQHEVLARVEERKINLLKECPICGACYDSTEKLCSKDNGELRLTLPVERTIEGRYRLDQLLGRGGMGSVYEAADLRLNRRVAVKILGGGLFGNADALRRFQREARASAHLNHKNIVMVHDYGVLNTEGAYLVMELLEGRTLGDVLRVKKYLSPAEATDLLDQFFNGVSAAHKAGIIHRDLKPENIFIINGEDDEPVVKILDFGLAKIKDPDLASKELSETMTSPGTVLGTFGYSSPEQLSGDSIDERSDIFSMGVIVVRTLTGMKPFNGKSYHEILTAIISRPFHLEGNTSQIKRLDAALQKCLAKNKEDRFASVEEMQQEMIPAIRECHSLVSGDEVHHDATTAIIERTTDPTM